MNMGSGSTQILGVLNLLILPQSDVQLDVFTTGMRGTLLTGVAGRHDDILFIYYNFSQYLRQVPIVLVWVHLF